MPKSTLKYDLFLLFTVLVWGVNFPILKATLDFMHPHVANVFRFTASLLVLGLLHARAQRAENASFFGPLREHFWALFGLGLMGYFLYQLCFILGVNRTTAGNAALIMAGAPLWTAIIGQLRGYDHLNGPAWTGLLLSLIGTGIVVVMGAKTLAFTSDTFTGNMLMLAASLFWGAYTVFNKPVMRTVSPESLTFFGLLLAMPFLIGISLPYMGDFAPSSVEPWVWIALVFSGGLSTGFVIVLWNAAIKHVGPSNTAVFGNLVPLIALLTSYLVLGERVTLGQLLGGALIIIGLLYMRRARRKAITPA